MLASSAVNAPVTVDSFVKHRRLALILLTLAYAMSMADRMVLSVLFEPIKTEFGLQDAQPGFLGGLSFALFYATLGNNANEYEQCHRLNEYG